MSSRSPRTPAWPCPSADVESQAAQAGSLYTLANEVTGASDLWDAGYTGRGVDVAVIDSGIVPVDGLQPPGKVVYGPDLTIEANTSAKNLDTYGHGTHMAGIIAGRDSSASTVTGNSSDFVGMAPDARIVSIKVADAKGQTDVSQAIAAIDWVVQNRNKNGLNIRVLNMSFGTDGVQDYLLDPLAYAAEQAWHQGIVVVVAVGNEGFGTGKVNNPAYDPYLIAVGSNDSQGTATAADDAVSAFSNDGDGTRNPDLVAPGERRGQPPERGVLPGHPVPAGPHRGAVLPWQRHLAGRRRRVRCRGAAHLAASGPHAGPGEGAAHAVGVADRRRHRPCSRAPVCSTCGPRRRPRPR